MTHGGLVISQSTGYIYEFKSTGLSSGFELSGSINWGRVTGWPAGEVVHRSASLGLFTGSLYFDAETDRLVGFSGGFSVGAPLGLTGGSSSTRITRIDPVRTTLGR
mgnify:CR=1 FL=1